MGKAAIYCLLFIPVDLAGGTCISGEITCYSTCNYIVRTVFLCTVKGSVWHVILNQYGYDIKSQLSLASGNNHGSKVI